MRIAPYTCVFATNRGRSRGFTILELVTAAAMLAVLLAVVGQLIVQTKRQSAAAQRRDCSLMAIENAMEELTALDWNTVNDEAIARYELSAELKKRWPAAKLTGEVEQQSEPVASKRVALQLTLTDEGRERPVSLTTWIYRSPVEEASQ